MARIVLDAGGTELDLGSGANAGDGDSLRAGGAKLKQWAADLNDMAAELYADQVVAHTGSTYTLLTTDIATVHTNRGNAALSTWQLPAGDDGLWYIAQRVANQEIRLEPNGSQIIGEGGAGKYLSIQTRGRVVIAWITDQWEVVSDSAGYNYEV